MSRETKENEIYEAHIKGAAAYLMADASLTADEQHAAMDTFKEQAVYRQEKMASAVEIVREHIQ